MEALAGQQVSAGQAMERMLTNFYKDSKSRKTGRYYENRLKKLDAEWSEFVRRDVELQKFRATNMEHPYFRETYFLQAQEVYEDLKGELKDGLNELEEAHSIGATVPDDTNLPKPILVDVAKRVVKQQSLIGSLKKAIENVNQLLIDQPDRSLAFCQQHLATLTNYWTTISDAHHELVAETTEYNSSAEISSLENAYQELMIRLMETTAKFGNASNETSQSNVKLPTVTIPTFSGDYLKWSSFSELFKQMIGGTTLPKTQKMFYLKTNLTGEASRLIAHLPVSEENYQAAWDILCNRYENQRLIVSAFLNSLLGLSCSNMESAAHLKRMHDTVTESLFGIRNLGVDTASWDPLIVHILLQKVDKETHRLFEQSLHDPRQVPKLITFLNFIESRFQLLESLGDSKGRKIEKKQSTFLTIKEKQACGCCRQKCINLRQCSKFLQMSTKARFDTVKKLQRCINCLQEGHNSKTCPSRNCLKCNKRHHTLLHHDNKKIPDQESSLQGKVGSVAGTTEISHSALSCLKTASYVFLGTAIIKIEGKDGQAKVCRAILDSGSQLNFITERLFHKLRLSGHEQPVDISGIGGSKLFSRGRVNLTILSRCTNFSTSIEAVILPEITSNQPSCTLDISSWPMPDNIELADPEFNTPRRVDLLLGADIYANLISPGQIKLSPDLPTLQNSVFGWVVLGKAKCEHPATSFLCGISTSLETQLERFWELEEIKYASKSLTQIEKDCEKLFYETISRNKEGRFVVRLSFQAKNELGTSREVAVRRFLNQEYRLQKDQQLKKEYTAFMNEMLRLDHMELISYTDIPKEHYFLPHHCVLRPESSTTKLRVVFDGSCKTSNQKSLNDILLVGPTVQDELFSVLLRFRLHRYVFTADISKMYRQILVANEDQNYQLIVWRDDPTKKLQYFRLKTVTYGTACAPYLATKVLQHLTEIQKEQYPLGSKAAQQDFYVDDIITGSNNLKEAIQIQTELINMLAEGGFHLHKWCANNSKLLESIPKDDLEKMVTFDKESEAHTKSLGVIWYPETDTYSIRVNLSHQKEITKRSILRDIALIYDPLGLINPVVVLGKIFLQQLWQLKVDWDATLTSEFQSKWSTFREQLKALNSLSIPRFVLQENIVEIQLHGFCDASDDAYGAVVYVRSTHQNGESICHLLCARSRVAPLKRLSTPRLELCSAQLLVTLVRKVKESLRIPIDQTYYWTDSMITLSRIINASSSQFKTFVANRISYIQEHTKGSEWKHIKSAENPADILSRGATPKELFASKAWFQGPKFLKTNLSTWPTTHIHHSEDNTETRKQKIVLISHITDQFLETINHRNSFKFLQRTIAYVLRFVGNARKTSPDLKNGADCLQPAELQHSLHTICKAIQATAFTEEVKALKKGCTLPEKNRLSAFKPFIDEEGLIRVGGRIENSTVDYTAKHQILLPHSNKIIQLIVQQIHEKEQHAGPQALLAKVRERFWPLKGKQLTSTIVQKCIRCCKAKPKLLKQVMGPLPKERIQPARPFTNVGIDFCGPISIHYRIRGKAPTKAYISVFVCFCTKAVHLELVSDLTKQAFLGALKRFIARRGKPTKIFCDNATNFVGAKNELQEVIALFTDSKTKQEIVKFCADEQIEWNFIPPRSPHFGGLWEAAVKAAKFHLKRVAGSVALTYEELHTIIVEAEAILNSRPLTPLSSNPNDLQALTPGHFLIGEPLSTLPNPRAKERNISLLQRKELIEACQMDFWKRWTKEYLQHLQITTKWRGSASCLSPGTLVLLKEDNTPPLKWPLGRVVVEHKGSDGLTRVVDVQTKTGILRRAIHNLCPLPVEDDAGTNKTTEQISASHGSSQVLLASTTRTKNKSTKRKIHPINTNWLLNPIMYNRPNSPQNQLHHESNTPQPPDVKKKKLISLGSIAPITLALLVLLIPPILGASPNQPIDRVVKITPFDEGTIAYFEDIAQTSMIADHWNIIAYFDMKHYWTDLRDIQNQIKIMKEMCVNRLTENHKQCLMLTMQFQIRLDTMSAKNDLLLNRSSIRKRRSPFDFVGMISNKLFGILDQDYADRMSDTIDKIRLNEDHAISLIKNQTSLIDSTINLISRDRDFINRQFQTVNEYMESFHRELNSTNRILNNQNILQTFNTLAIHLTLTMEAYAHTQSTLFNIVTDSNNGKVTPWIITPNQLLEEIRLIREHIPASLTIPGQSNPNALIHLYKLLHVRARITPDKTIFKITVPLILADTFQLFNVIPVTFKLSSESVQIKTSAKFLALTLHRDQYYILSEDEVSRCIINDNGHYICNQKHTVYAKNDGPAQCELSLLNQATILPKICRIEPVNTYIAWTQMHNPNTWIYSLQDYTPTNIVCGSQTYQTKLRGTGVLQFIDDCSLREGLIKITAHHRYTNKITSTYNSSIAFNLSSIDELPLHTFGQEFPKINIFNTSNEINQLKKTITNIKEQQETNWTTTTAHTSISFGLSVTIIAIVFISTVYFCKKRKSKSTPTAEPKSTTINYNLRPQRTRSF